MECVTCKEAKPEQEFHADNKTGWSKICKACRTRRNARAYMRRYRKAHKLEAEADQVKEAQKALILANQLLRLKKDFKRFTLINRNEIKRLEKKLKDISNPDPRTVEALERRKKKQLEAEAIHNGQVQMVMVGIMPKPINEIWRMNHGEHARGESQKENQADIGYSSDISLLTVYGGDGEIGSS